MRNELPHERRVRVLSGIDVLLGLWLILTPWTIGAPGAAVARSGIVVGVLAILFAVGRFIWKRTAPLAWGIVLVGAWAAMSPWVLEQHTGDMRTWSYVLAGLLLILMEAYSLTSSTTQPNWRQRQTGPR